MTLLRDWFQRYFSDPQVVILSVLLVFGFGFVLLLGDMLIPVIASLVIAYLLDGPVCWLRRRFMPRPLAVWVVFIGFLTVVAIILIGLMPVLSRQVQGLIEVLPIIVGKGQELLMRLPESYPAVFTEAQVLEMINTLRVEITLAGQEFLSTSLTSVVSLFTLIVYLVLLPLLIFFFLKDKDSIIAWFAEFLPENRRLAQDVWREVDVQIANYVRGKVWEIIIVGAVTYVAFVIMGVNFAMLLAALVGISVVVPYVGATAVTVPVAVAGFFQYGWTPEFAWVMAVYGIIQALDGNVLVPLLFSEVVNLHPIAIIVAILFFGGIWGFWGVFFAIPLATLVQAVLRAWPRRHGAAAA
ncbi:MAG: AI-2E family transporter [Zoogloeaceae bacterium]|nr:AI-2E family transporter [Gammaproteobacteria bacterium]MCP5230725.1 AI-2E family transporter [Zoogloeaceae bacterium]